jgi:hypothetical protein
MLSAIVFGRNDDHGGNFRHRAILSINMLAEQLGVADEIVFVDWNSADGAPTFPEAVANSLTERARNLLRVVKVGRDIHAEFVDRGAFMPVVPVVAYNVGIRRANPNNKWILITTTDMLLISRDAGRSLSEVAITLKDGVYGLPRFELPRWIWRGLEPSDTAAATTCLSSFGKRLHLEEAIRLPPPELFDAPGDFQLMLRADLILIDGFDEGMSLGALGPDSNLLKRLALRGRVPQSLERQFGGYHCDHTSFPTASHRTGRMENDRKLHFDEVEVPDIPFQRSTWGLAGRVLPEVTLSHSDTTRATSIPADPSGTALLAERLASVAAVIGPEQTELYEVKVQSNFNRAGYPTRHVVAFLLDHVFALTGPIFYVGANERLTSLLAAVLDQLEPRRQLLSFRPDDRATFERRYCDLDREDEQPLLVFDFGFDAEDTPLKIQKCAEPIRQTLWHIRDRFEWCVDRERKLSPNQERSVCIVTINTINTEFEQLVLSSLDCGLSPFTTRMRSGRVNPVFPPPVPVVSHPAARHMAERLGRKRGIHAGEFARAWAIANRLVRSLPAGRLPSAWLAPSVDALLDWPGIATAIGATDGRILEIRSRMAASREAAPVTQRPRVAHDVIAAAKLASAHDWEDPDWYEVARWYLGDHRSYNAFQRHRKDWEHIHFLFCLRRRGILDTDAEVVVLAHTPDRFAHMLARRVRKVHLVNMGWKPNSRFLRVPELRLDSSIRVYSGLRDPAFRDVTGAALIAQRLDRQFFGLSRLRRACRVLKPDGIVGVSLEVCTRPAEGIGRLARRLHPRPSIDDLAADSCPARAALPSEFKAFQSSDWNVDPESFELIAPAADRKGRQMTADRRGRRITSAIRWFSRGLE